MIYQDINAIITNINKDFSAAEAHGLAAGILCVNNQAETGFWLQEIQQDEGEFSGHDLSDLENLFEDTRDELMSDEFSFEPLLPMTQSPLTNKLKP